MTRILTIIALLFVTPAWAGNVEMDFRALQFLGEVALGLLGFSAILIGLSRVDDGGFNPPDEFRVKLLLFTGLGALFASILPFIIFDPTATEQSWRPLLLGMFIYILFGPIYFIPKARSLRNSGYKDIFSIPIIAFNATIFTTNAAVSGSMALISGEMNPQLYSFCVLLFLVQCTSAFIRTIFYRVK
ncbi:hypothetical protein N9X91_00390 [Alphaproteobacteria bacterium]|nr:hypothetical protein [Alphaproteobacteria bacterium]